MTIKAALIKFEKKIFSKKKKNKLTVLIEMLAAPSGTRTCESSITYLFVWKNMFQIKAIIVVLTTK